MKKYLILPGLIFVLGVYLLGLSAWENRIDKSLSALQPVSFVQTEETEPAEKISINSATKEELMRIDGIGEKTAENILALREKLGGFQAFEELMEVKGIGEKTLEKLKESIKID